MHQRLNLAKRAADATQGGLGLTPVQTDYAKWLGKFLLGAGALGAATRGTTGMAELVRENMKGRAPTPDPLMINVPYRQPKPQEEQKVKLAEVDPAKSQGLLNYFFKGAPDAKTMWDIPATYPTTFLGGAAALTGGYSLVDKLVANRKKKMQEDELNDAKGEYEQSLLEQFKPIPEAKIKPVKMHGPSLTKLSSADRLSEEAIKALLNNEKIENSKLASISEKLDKLTEKHLKQASIVDDTIDGFNKHVKPLFTKWPTEYPVDSAPGTIAPKLLGGYATLAPVLAGASGMAMYQYAKDHDTDSVNADAVRRQLEEKRKNKPSEVFAHLVPVDDTGKTVQDNLKMGSTNPADDISAKAAMFVKKMLGE